LGRGSKRLDVRSQRCYHVLTKAVDWPGVVVDFVVVVIVVVVVVVVVVVAAAVVVVVVVVAAVTKAADWPAVPRSTIVALLPLLHAC